MNGLSIFIDISFFLGIDSRIEERGDFPHFERFTYCQQYSFSEREMHVLYSISSSIPRFSLKKKESS